MLENSLYILMEWFRSQGTLLDWMTALGTLSASFTAIYFGVIRPNNQRARFSIVNPNKTTSYSDHNIGRMLSVNKGDMVEVGFFVEQIYGSPSRNVNILLKKVWIFSDDGDSKTEWLHFIPSNLLWASEDHSFSKGVRRYCNLGVWGNHPGNDFVGEVFTISTKENRGDPIFDAFSPVLPSPKKFEMELMISGENVKASEFKIILELLDPRVLESLGADGLAIEGERIDSVDIKIINY